MLIRNYYFMLKYKTYMIVNLNATIAIITMLASTWFNNLYIIIYFIFYYIIENTSQSEQIKE